MIGVIDPAARVLVGYQWFNTLPENQAVRCLADSGVPADLAAEVAAQRPLAEPWLGDFRRRAAAEAEGTERAAAEAACLRILTAMLEGRPAQP